MKKGFCIVFAFCVLLPVIAVAKPIMIRLVFSAFGKDSVVNTVYVDNQNYALCMDDKTRHLSYRVLKGVLYETHDEEKTYWVIGQQDRFESMVDEIRFGNLTELLSELHFKKFELIRKVWDARYRKVCVYSCIAEDGTSIIQTFTKSKAVYEALSNWNRIENATICDWGKRMVYVHPNFGVLVGMQDLNGDHKLRIEIGKPDYKLDDFIQSYINEE